MPHKAGFQRRDRQKGPRLGAAQFGMNFAKPQTEPVRGDHAMQWLTRDAAQTIERSALDQTDAQVAQERRDVSGVRPLTLLAIQLLPKIEERDRLLCNLLAKLCRVADDLKHFWQVLLESRRGIFREPFWRQPF